MLNNLIVLNTCPVDAQVGGQNLALDKISMVKDEDGGRPSCGDEVSLLWMQAEAPAACLNVSE